MLEEADIKDPICPICKKSNKGKIYISSETYLTSALDYITESRRLMNDTKMFSRDDPTFMLLLAVEEVRRHCVKELHLRLKKE